MVRTLKSVDFPTFGIPTTPILRWFPGLEAHKESVKRVSCNCKNKLAFPKGFWVLRLLLSSSASTLRWLRVTKEKTPSWKGHDFLWDCRKTQQWRAKHCLVPLGWPPICKAMIYNWCVLRTLVFFSLIATKPKKKKSKHLLPPMKSASLFAS